MYVYFKEKISILVLLTMLPINAAGCGIQAYSIDHRLKIGGKAIPHLYGFYIKDLTSVLELIEMDGLYDYHPQRDITGYEMHFQTESNSYDTYLALKTDGSFEIRERLKRPQIPYYATIDLSEKYFINQIGSNTTEVKSVQNPSLFLQLPFVGDYIFLKGDCVYVFGRDSNKKESNRKIKKSEIICYILKTQKAQLQIYQKIHIKWASKVSSSFYIKDLSPFSDDVLLYDRRDVPFLDILYLYNLKTHSLKRIGSSGKGFHLFLAEDIVSNVENNYKKD